MRPRIVGKRLVHDYLEFIEPTRLRAAMELGQWTPSTLAARAAVVTGGEVQENRQTIHALTRGERRKRCRLSRLQTLAKALDVPKEFLMGQPLYVPLNADGPVNHLIARAPRVGLAALRLALRCAKRTAEECQVKRLDAFNSIGPKDPRLEVVNAIMRAIVIAAHAGNWQHLMLSEPDVPVLPQALEHGMVPLWQHTQPSMTQEEEEASLGALALVRFVLDPWLEKKALLNYATFGQLIAVVDPNFYGWVPDSDRPSVPFTYRDGRYVVTDPRSPFALLRWPAPTSEAKP